MGNSFISAQKAAELIGMSIRTIYRCAKSGLIRTKLAGRSTLFDEEDVLKLKKSKEDSKSKSAYKSEINRIYREIIDKLMVDIQTLRSQMNAVMKILDIRYEPLAFTAPEYERMYLSAEQYASEGWPPHVEDIWAEYFTRVKIEDLERIESITKDPHPWRVLLKLATTMHVNPWNKQLSDILAAGRANIHQVAGIW